VVVELLSQTADGKDVMRNRVLALTVVIATLTTIPAAAAGPHEEVIVVLNPTNRPVVDVADEVAEGVSDVEEETAEAAEEAAAPAQP